MIDLRRLKQYQIGALRIRLIVASKGLPAGEIVEGDCFYPSIGRLWARRTVGVQRMIRLNESEQGLVWEVVR